jgi:REP element-mobilizing transposase RayT
MRWVFEAKKRFGLCVLDYIVTSNHLHRLVKDTGGDVLAQSMQLTAGRTAQEYNQRKNRHGAFWEDRYHATAIQANEHLHRGLVYIDLNMVRAGVVNHPERWKESGFKEIQKPPKRYAIIDLQSLSELNGFEDLRDFQRAHRHWVVAREWTHIFYPPDAVRLGIDLESLVVVRLAKPDAIARAADKLLRSGGFGLVVLDLGVTDIPMPLQSRLAGLAHHHHGALICITQKEDNSFSLGSLVSLRVKAERNRRVANEFACSLRVLKDKRLGPTWPHEEVRCGVAGLH